MKSCMVLNFPRISDKVAWRRLRLAGHYFRHKELFAGKLVLWGPSHRHRRRERPCTNFVDTLKRDLGDGNKSESPTEMTSAPGVMLGLGPP